MPNKLGPMAILLVALGACSQSSSPAPTPVYLSGAEATRRFDSGFCALLQRCTNAFSDGGLFGDGGIPQCVSELSMLDLRPDASTTCTESQAEQCVADLNNESCETLNPSCSTNNGQSTCFSVPASCSGC